LRRALEALFDMGRHIAAKGFGEAVTEYKEIASTLNRRNMISASDLELMKKAVESIRKSGEIQSCI